MTTETKAISRIVRETIKCLGREAEAIAHRDFRMLKSLTAKKVDLADALEQELAAVAAKLDEAIAAEFSEMQEMARSNAQRLLNLRDGTARARTRIQQLTAQDERIGVYQAKGTPLKARPVSASAKSV